MFFVKETLKFRGENRERLFWCSYAAVESLCVQLNIPKMQGTLDKVRQAGKYLLTGVDLNVVSSVVIKTFAVNLSWQFYCWTWGMRLNEGRKSVSSSLFGWVCGARRLFCSVCHAFVPPWVTLTDNDALTFFSLFFLFLFLFVARQ